MTSENEIKKFWDERAKKFNNSMCATLGETYLRKLEIKSLLKILKQERPLRVLEIGCGNGYSTFIYAEKFPKMRIIATDYSEKMIDVAKKSYMRKNIEYKVWDITEFNKLPFKSREFDLIFSQRVIQNLPLWETQKDVIKNLINMLTNNGQLCLMECSENGVTQLNKCRKQIGKRSINGIIPWHNKFINDQKLKEEFEENLTKIICFSSSYMFITRLICHKLDRIAWLMPSIGKFGYDRIYIFKR